MQESQDVLGRKLKCRPHAETVVTDSFFANGTTYASDDRYVGSSKRSCFGCALYMRLQPARMQQRPAHGNIWVQWLFPRPLTREGSEANDKRDGRAADSYGG